MGLWQRITRVSVISRVKRGINGQKCFGKNFLIRYSKSEIVSLTFVFEDKIDSFLSLSLSKQLKT